jgi:arsenate reductase
VTLCGDADENCPIVPAKTARVHWPLADPARADGDEQAVMSVFRSVRDDIRSRVQLLFHTTLHQ